MNVVVFGASGYVGGRLIPILLAGGHTVRAVTRSPGSLRDHPWREEVEVVEADLLQPDTLTGALTGMDAAFYLVHSLERPDFEEVDRQAAANLASAAGRTGLQRIIYLGGLGRGELSPHLASRQEVGEVLSQGSVPVTEFRAAVIIGSGSLSFEMTRYLTEVLPVMITPRWVQTRTQPIAIGDVLFYLAASLEQSESAGRVFEIGGPDVLTYEAMMQRYAEAAGLKRRIFVRVPFLTLGLSARWIGLVTPLSNDVAGHLAGSLKNEVVVEDRSADEVFPHQTIGYDESVRRAIEQTRGANIPTRWARMSWQPADPMPSDPLHAFGKMFSDRRVLETTARPEEVAWAFMRVGGAHGYYGADWAWRIRGLVDQLFGGAGLRRGRRHPDRIWIGEPLDFWRVVSVHPGSSLELKAEMRLPGEAWLMWNVETVPGGSRLEQTAWFAPRGLLGRAYWYLVAPFHAFVFPKMARGIIEAAVQHEITIDSSSVE